eukprot:5643380-Pleurochrysis_carterae.AAC.1
MYQLGTSYSRHRYIGMYRYVSHQPHIAATRQAVRRAQGRAPPVAAARRSHRRPLRRRRCLDRAARSVRTYIQQLGTSTDS